MSSEPTITLAGGVQLPRIGLGTWPMDDDEVARVLPTAIELGYRHVDTAEQYGNETGVGRGLRAAGVPREDVFVTTKFNRKWHDDPRAALRASLDRLGLDYVDLHLIHWPNPDQDRYVPAWAALLELRAEGLIRAAGVSNFTIEHLTRVIDATGVAPEVNQVEAHPYVDTARLRAFHAEHGIVTESWSPVGRAGDLLAEPAVRAAATRAGCTPAQAVLAWGLAQDAVVIPKSSDPGRLAENLAAADVRLTGEELAAITALARGERGELDPDHFGH